MTVLVSHTLLLFANDTRVLHSPEEAMAMAMRCNKQVLKTRELVYKAELGVLESYTKWLPQLVAESQVTKSQFEQKPLQDSTVGYLTQLTLTQALFSSGKYYNVVLQKLQKQQLNLIYCALINDLTYRVKSAYYKVVLDKLVMATQAERIELLSNLLKQMEGRLSIGEAIIFQVNQSKVALANATALYYQALRDLKTDRDTLAQVIGMDPACHSVEVESLCQAIPVPMISKLEDAETKVAALPAPTLIRDAHTSFFHSQEITYWEALSNQQRPDLFQAGLLMTIAAEKVHDRQGTYLPTADLTMEYGGMPALWALYPSKNIEDMSFQWSVGLDVKWLLFDSFGRELSIRQAEAQWRAERYNYLNMQQLVHQEVRKQIWDIEESIAQLAYAKTNVALADELVQQAHDQLDVGYINIFDYEIAVDERVRAKLLRDQAAYNLYTSYLGLQHAVGSLKDGK